jgi:hypothetical protein
LFIKPYTIASPTGFVSYQLHDVTTPITTLTNTASGATGTYADLGGGDDYGERNVFVSESPAKLSIPLNNLFDGVALANSGGQIALGGVLTLDPTPNNEKLFGSSPATAIPDDVQLWLGFVPATVPSAAFAAGSPTALGGNRFQFVLNGTTGTTNEIQASPDLANWDVVRTLYLATPSATFHYTNTAFPYRYFRARLLQ